MDFQEIFNRYNAVIDKDGAYTRVTVDRHQYDDLLGNCPPLQQAIDSLGSKTGFRGSDAVLWLYDDSFMYHEDDDVRKFCNFLREKIGLPPAQNMRPPAA